MEDKETVDQTYREAAKGAIRRRIKEDAPKQARMHQLLGDKTARGILKAIDEIGDPKPDVPLGEAVENTNKIVDKVALRKSKE